MTLVEAEIAVRPVNLQSGGRAPGRLAATIGVHYTVDAFAFVIVALLPLLTTRLGLVPWQVATLLAAGSICSGAIQPLVAWLSDLYDTRMFATLGLLVAVISIGLIGFVDSFAMLLAVQCVSSAGIGAFHPPAVAVTGQLSGAKRTLGVSCFFLAGMLGSTSGNVVSPLWVGAFSPVVDGTPMVAHGLRALVWFVIPGLMAVVLLRWAIHDVPHAPVGAREIHARLSVRERRQRWSAVGLLYIGAALRFIANLALVYLYVKWTQQYTLAQAGATELTEALALRASAFNGVLQGSMPIGMGVGGLAAGILLRAHHEKLALVLVPMFGAGAIMLAPMAGDLGAAAIPVAMGIAMLAGLGFGAMVPVAISLAQRLLPHRTGLASSLMLGGAWMFAAVGPFFVDWAESRVGLRGAFILTAAILLVAGLIGIALPGRTIRQA